MWPVLLFWGARGCGFWFDLHRYYQEQANDRRPNDRFVRVMNLVSFGSGHIALFLRLTLYYLPALLAWVNWSGA